jgi:hypothetical protein
VLVVVAIATNMMGSMLLSSAVIRPVIDERGCLAGGVEDRRQQLAGKVSKSMDVIALQLGGSSWELAQT